LTSITHAVPETQSASAALIPAAVFANFGVLPEGQRTQQEHAQQGEPLLVIRKDCHFMGKFSNLER
jgi:hypothetical protein